MDSAVFFWYTHMFFAASASERFNPLKFMVKKPYPLMSPQFTVGSNLVLLAVVPDRVSLTLL